MSLRPIRGAKSLRAWPAVLASLVVLAVLGYPKARSLVLGVDESPAARGERLAAEKGCFACHGTAGAGGVRNQNAAGPVPGFHGAQGLRLSRTIDDVRAFVRDGAPAWRHDQPGYENEMRWVALRMPAYRDVLDEREVEDLAQFVWLAAVGGQVLPADPQTQRGALVAREQGCFQCHGELGAGGRANPGSLKGYVPGFWGSDFEELVHDDHELRRWIEAGELERISENPIGKRFFRRQRIAMPPFGQFLSPDDVDALVAYVRWLHREAPGQIRAARLSSATGERVVQRREDELKAVEEE